MTRQIPTRIFLGPTMPHAEARRILEAEYVPPITHDDLSRARADNIEVIGIMDAAFLRDCTATPTQIVECLRRGLVIYGAASAGALRAVETEQFGMRGVGGIFELFRAGFDAEDELAVSYDPATLRPLSEAMINVRYAAAHAVEAGVLTAHGAETMADVAKEIYFADRTYPLIVEQARGLVTDPELDGFSRFVAERRERLDWKRADAVRCLREMARYLEQAEARLARAAGGDPGPTARRAAP